MRNSESTDGKSATYPQTIRANVFVIPITDISNGAWDFSMPWIEEIKVMKNN